VAIVAPKNPIRNDGIRQATCIIYKINDSKIDFNATKNVENNLEYIKSFKVLLCGAVIYGQGVCGNGTPFKSFKFYSEIILRPFDIRYLREFTGSVL